jgi:hypothetical protein
MDMTQLLKEMILNNIKIRTTAISGSWCEVDSKKDLALYGAMMKDGSLLI